ncbi:MAG: hypothetical protein ACRDT6_27570 [Micromonosporaceae bacterium]
MTALEEVLDRLWTEPGFRVRLTSRPWAALAGYDLTEAERERLAVELIAGPRSGGTYPRQRVRIDG